MFNNNYLEITVNPDNRVTIGFANTKIVFGYLDEDKVRNLSTIWDIFEDVHEVIGDGANWEIKMIYTHLANCMPGVQIALREIVNKRQPKDKKELCKALFRQIRPLKTKKDIKL